MRTAAAAAACLALLAIAGCKGDSEEGASSTPPPTEESTPIDESEDPGTEVDETEIAVDKTVSDPITSETLKVISYVPSVAVTDEFVEKYPAYEDAQVLLVKVEISVSADAKYSTVMGEGAGIRLYGTPRNDISPQSATLLMDELYPDKYPKVEDVRSGETATGWVGWVLKEKDGAAPWTIYLNRLPFSVMGTDEQIPAEEFPIELPEA
jgi:hypothetical protein